MPDTNNYNVPIGLDYGPANEGFRELYSQLTRAQQAGTEAGTNISNSLNRGTRAANDMNTAVRETTRNLNGTTQQARTLEGAINEVVRETRQVNSEPVNRFRAAWEKANQFFRSGRTTVREFFTGVREGVADAIADLRRYEAEAQRASAAPAPGRGNSESSKKESGDSGGGVPDSVLGLGDLITGGLITGGIVELGSKMLELGKNVISTRAEFQKFEEVLTIALGDRSQAQEAMKQINKFASETPFGVKELTEDYVKLVNRGFIPTRDAMRQIGDLAASQGKSFDQLTEGILDAQSGEFERLKEFGIKASSAGNSVTLSFGGVSKTVKKTEADIRSAVLAFGDLPQVAGGMAAVSKTLDGQISNLGDSVDQLYNTLGQGTQDFVAEAVGGISVVITALNDSLKDGTLSAFFKPITDGFSDITNAVKTNYATILEFAKASGVFEQIEHAVDSLVEIIGGLLSGIADTAVYLVNLYKESETFRDIINNTLLLPLRLAWAGAILLIEGIRAIPYAFEGLKAGVQQAIDNIRLNFKALIADLEIIRLKVKKAFEFDDEKSNGLKTQIEALQRDRQGYIAGVKSVAEAAQAAYLKAEADAEAKRLARKAGKPAEAQPDVPIVGRGIKTPTQGPTDAEIKKALDLQKKKNDQLVKLAQELRDAEIAAMKDGYEKQKAIIEDNFKTKVENVKKEKALTPEATEQQNKLLVALEVSKNAELDKLRLDHIRKEAELQAEVQKVVLEAGKDTKDRAVALIDLEFNARAEAIKEKFKDESVLRDEALTALEKSRTTAKQEVNITFGTTGIKEQEDAAIESLNIIQKYGKKSAKQEKAIQLEILGIKIKAAEDTIALLLDSGKDESDAQVKNARSLLKNLNAEFEGLKSTTTGKHDIFDIFGLNISDKDKEQLTGAFSSVMGSLTQVWEQSIQAQIDIKQKQIDILDEQIDKLEDNVDKQKELAEAGLANDLAVEQTKLDEKKKQRDKEQLELEAIQKKQNKLAQAQILANGVMQVSNLVLSATQIFAAHSGIPFVGVALAVAAVAAMYATFAGMKAKAAELAKPVASSFRKGGYIGQGKDHAQGGITYYSPDHTDAKELQVGEFIMNRESTAKYRDLIEAINNDDFGKFAISNDWLTDLLDGSGIKLQDDVTGDVLRVAQSANKIEITQKSAPQVNKWNDKRLDSMANSLKYLEKVERERPEVSETDTHIITKTANKITKLRKQ